MKVNVFYEKKKYKCVIDFKKLIAVLKLYAESELNNSHSYKDIQVSFNLISRREQKRINRTFLNHNFNTDVITFNLSENRIALIGDVYINLKKVRKNACKYNVSIYEEIHRVFIHGFLHLLGYDDKSFNDKKIMRIEENRFLKYVNKKCSTWNNRYRN